MIVRFVFFWEFILDEKAGEWAMNLILRVERRTWRKYWDSRERLVGGRRLYVIGLTQELAI